MQKPGKKKKSGRDRLSDKSVIIASVLRDLEQRQRLARSQRATARKIGIDPTRFNRLYSGLLGAGLRDLELIAKAYGVTIDSLLRNQEGLVDIMLPYGFGYRRAHELICPDHMLQRDVALRVLGGEARAEVARHLAQVRRAPSAVEPEDVEDADREIDGMVRGALGLGFVELVLPEQVEGWGRSEKAGALAEALARVTPDGRPVATVVVPTVAGDGFDRDPVAPYLVGRLAHTVVRRFLERHRGSRVIGLAGGMHVAEFVGCTGKCSSPLPAPSRTDRAFTFLPLTFEPFYDHTAHLADALAGELARRAMAIHGDRHIEAPSFKPFGYLEDRLVGDLQRTSIDGVRQRYPFLDVAIFSCGGDGGEGWVERMRKLLGLDDEGRAVTDVCLNLLDENGRLIRLSKEHRRELLGADIELIRGLASKPDRLALLLGSGPEKGKPMSILARAGVMNAVVCDEAAADACIAAIIG